MDVPWDIPVRFSWIGADFNIGRVMTLGGAADYFATLLSEQRSQAQIGLLVPLSLNRDLPPVYELDGCDMVTLLALRRPPSARSARQDESVSSREAAWEPAFFEAAHEHA